MWTPQQTEHFQQLLDHFGYPKNWLGTQLKKYPFLFDQPPVLSRPPRKPAALESNPDLLNTTYTIDELSTTDLDDAFTVLEVSESRFRWVLHITDVASQVPATDPKMPAIIEQTASVYFPECPLELLPHELSNEALSLQAAPQKLVLSYEFVWTPETGPQLTDLRVECIQIDHNLSYQQANRLLRKEGGPGWRRLEQWIADHIPKQSPPRAFWKVSGNPQTEVQIQQVNRESPAHRLVEYFAVQANHRVSEWVSQQGIPGIFRSQRPRVQNPEKQESFFSTTPTPHPRMEVDVYGYHTSPLRRTVDLIQQQQLRAALTATPLPYSEDDIIPHLELFNRREQQYRQLENTLRQYWKFHYLLQNQGHLFQVKAYPSHKRGKLQFYFPEIGFRYLVRASGNPDDLPQQIQILDGDWEQETLYWGE